MVSVNGWVDGGSALGVMVVGVIVGIYSIIRGRKLESNVLRNYGIMVFFISFLYLGPVTDLIYLILNSINLPDNLLYGILSYMWVAPGIVMAMYVGAQLMAQKSKTAILIVYLGLSVVFELFLFLDTSSMFKFPTIANPGDLIDSRFEYASVGFLLIALFLFSVFLFCGVGALNTALRASGDVRKKFLFIAAGFMLFVFCGVFDAFAEPGPMLFMVRVGMITSIVFLYLGIA